MKQLGADRYVSNINEPGMKKKEIVELDYSRKEHL